MRISDWSSDVCSSDLAPPRVVIAEAPTLRWFVPMSAYRVDRAPFATFRRIAAEMNQRMAAMMRLMAAVPTIALDGAPGLRLASDGSLPGGSYRFVRSEEHTSELQSLMRISYAVFCLKKKN